MVFWCRAIPPPASLMAFWPNGNGFFAFQNANPFIFADAPVRWRANRHIPTRTVRARSRKPLRLGSLCFAFVRGKWALLTACDFSPSRFVERKRPKQKTARGLPVRKGSEEWDLRICLQYPSENARNKKSRGVSLSGRVRKSGISAFI